MAPNVPTPPATSKDSSGSTLTIVFIGLLAYRIVNSYYVQTFFQPDEYFQALEPAWQIAFGPQSGAWITWEWREELRTSAHPYLFAGAYRAMDAACSLLNASGTSRVIALGWAPRLLQAALAALMDLATWRTAVKVYGNGHSASLATFVLTILSPWQWFCSVRTFANSLEATLTAISISLFPWRWYLQPDKSDKTPPPAAVFSSHSIGEVTLQDLGRLFFSAPKDMLLALTAAAVAFYLRPTNIIIWIAISAGLVGCNRNYPKAATLVQSAAFVGTAVVTAFAGIDHAYYGEWAFPPLRFLYLNLVQSLAVFYGTNRPDYYFTEGLPLLLTTALPFAAIGVWQSLRSGHVATAEEYIERQTRFVFAFACVATVLALSIIAHKEMRFIYPILPILHILAAKPFAEFFHPIPVPRTKIRQAILAALISANIYIAGYVSMTHQRGVVDVMHYLRHQQEASLDTAARTNITAGFLMPCHSTPWRSHLVYPEIRAWALTCEPPVNVKPEERATYLDEADIFYADPTAWLDHNMMESDDGLMEPVHAAKFSDAKREWPDYLIFFEQLESTLTELPLRNSYKECRRFFNTHWIDDSRRKGEVVVWCRRQQ